jgi:hypothetical protein
MAAIDRIEGLRLAHQGLPMTARQASAIIGCSKNWLLWLARQKKIEVAGHRGIKVMFAAQTVLMIARGAGVPVENEQSNQTAQTVP